MQTFVFEKEWLDDTIESIQVLAIQLTHEGTCQICQKILGVDILGRAVVDVGHS
jgi:hypothetical protein